jgi:hypothetical protein
LIELSCGSLFLLFLFDTFDSLSFSYHTITPVLTRNWVLFFFFYFFFFFFFFFFLQLKVYRSEFAKFLSSWRATEEGAHSLLDTASPGFQAWVRSFYATDSHNVAKLLHDLHGNEAFSATHLRESGWEVGTGDDS